MTDKHAVRKITTAVRACKNILAPYVKMCKVIRDNYNVYYNHAFKRWELVNKKSCFCPLAACLLYYQPKSAFIGKAVKELFGWDNVQEFTSAFDVGSWAPGQAARVGIRIRKLHLRESL